LGNLNVFACSGLDNLIYGRLVHLLTNNTAAKVHPAGAIAANHTTGANNSLTSIAANHASGANDISSIAPNHTTGANDSLTAIACIACGSNGLSSIACGANGSIACGANGSDGLCSKNPYNKTEKKWQVEVVLKCFFG